MNLKDLAQVTWNITHLHITGRRDGKYVHCWIIGEGVSENPPQGVRWDVAAGRITMIDKNINYHGTPKRGGPEMGWGLIDSEIPKELLHAEITRLDMKLANMVSYEVRVDVELPPEQITF